MRIFAHRGASGYFPENTLPAFEKAIEMGSNGIETDVQMTKDGVLVLIHDERVDRTTDGIGYIKNLTFNELRKLNAGHNRHFYACKIPTVEELIELVLHKDIIVNFELKTNVIKYENIEEKLLKIIYKYNLENRVIISSFNLSSIIRCKEIDDNIKVGYLTFQKPELHWLKFYDINAVHPYYRIVDLQFLDKMKAFGIQTNVFTVNNKRRIYKLILADVDGIITDYPDMALEVYRQTVNISK